jgi:hypothetical protein
MKRFVMTVAVSAAMLIPSVYAQTAGQDTTISQRKENQQDRIANGVASGQLTAGETSRLESKEANLNSEIRTDRQANNGQLTAPEKAQINRQQNRLSGDIYNDKHNAAQQHYGNNEVDARRENQQDRIAQGIRSGQMTAGEAAKTEGHEAAINHEVHADRAANGGHLTNNQKAQVNRQLNKESARIYNQKHNAAKR